LCCLRFDADVLLANVYGSPRYKKDMAIEIYDFLEEYKDYLNTILPGHKFYNKSTEEVEAFVNRYPNILKWKDPTKRKILQADERVLNPDYFNQNYPGNVPDKLQFAADVCLGVWILEQQDKKLKSENDVRMQFCL
jgi:hypothetical protein